MDYASGSNNIYTQGGSDEGRKCEECGNIANLGVYENNVNSSNDELIVLCKKCYEKNINAVKLHYE